jgi:acyl carrier protein
VAPALRLALLEAHLIQQIAQVLRLPPDQIDSKTPLPTLGLDSLMALELRNRLELSLGATLSATLIWGYPTVAALAPFLAEKMGLELDVAGLAPANGAEARQPDQPTDLDELSDEAADALLAEKLAHIDRDYLADEQPTR